LSICKLTLSDQDQVTLQLSQSSKIGVEIFNWSTLAEAPEPAISGPVGMAGRRACSIHTDLWPAVWQTKDTNQRKPFKIRLSNKETQNPLRKFSALHKAGLKNFLTPLY
jgi:hypothetical protein